MSPRSQFRILVEGFLAVSGEVFHTLSGIPVCHRRQPATVSGGKETNWWLIYTPRSPIPRFLLVSHVNKINKNWSSEQMFCLIQEFFCSCDRNLPQVLITKLGVTDSPVSDHGKSSYARAVCNFGARQYVMGSKERGNWSSGQWWATLTVSLWLLKT